MANEINNESIDLIIEVEKLGPPYEKTKTRVHNVLTKNNILNFEKLLTFTERELLTLPDFGLTSLSAIKHILKNRNLSLKLRKIP